MVPRMNKDMIRLRRSPAYHDTLVYGSFVPMHEHAHNLVVYRRERDVSILVAANWGNETQIVEIPEGYTRILLNNYADLKREAPGQLRLAPWQSVVVTGKCLP